MQPLTVGQLKSETSESVGSESAYEGLTKYCIYFEVELPCGMEHEIPFEGYAAEFRDALALGQLYVYSYLTSEVDMEPSPGGALSPGEALATAMSAQYTI